MGTADLHVSRLAFGAWSFGGDWGPVQADESKRAIRKAFDLGINFFDTAQAYGFGAAETVLGEALLDEIKHHRDGMLPATKGGLRKQGDDLVRDSSPAWLRHGLESSLRALGTDYIDLYQLHWPDPQTPFDETANARWSSHCDSCGRTFGNVLRLAQERSVPMPVTAVAQQICAIEEAKDQDEDFSAVIRTTQDLAGRTLGTLGDRSSRQNRQTPSSAEETLRARHQHAAD